MQVILIGSGNVAHVLGREMKKAGHSIQQVLSRNLPQAIANELGAEAITTYQHLNNNADVYLLAVYDGAVPAVVASLPKIKGVIAHTAGALPMGILAPASSNYGVVYPLQSLRKEKQDYENIPLLVDGNTAAIQQQLTAFAQTLSNRVAATNDADRLKLHTAAVVVSNFTNHLYALSENFCRKEAVDFHLLQPLMEEITIRMRHFSPAQMQTGPAARGDEATIYQHLQVLEQHAHLQKLYRVLTESIQTMDNG